VRTSVREGEHTNVTGELLEAQPGQVQSDTLQRGPVMGTPHSFMNFVPTCCVTYVSVKAVCKKIKPLVPWVLHLRLKL
jgi:hypothetical protein